MLLISTHNIGFCGEIRKNYQKKSPLTGVMITISPGAGTLIMMTREFDPITETSLYPDQFGEGKFLLNDAMCFLRS